MKRTCWIVLLALTAVPVTAQSTTDRPLPPPVPFHRDSGPVANASDEARTVHIEQVRVAGAAWLRLYFGDVELGEGSFLRLTSEADGEVQELDAEALELWSGTSAYFNGDTVLVETVGGPNTAGNRMVLEKIAYTEAPIPLTLCGEDDRVTSDEDWSGRIQPNGCSGAMWNEAGCMVSAGHCFDSPSDAQLIEFRVPLNNGSCQHQHPPVADQFPIVADQWQASGVGNDWAIALVGPNNLGETPYERYGEIRRLALSMPGVGESMTIWGYGSDSQCLLDNVQQISLGTITGMGFSDVSHNADTQGGNSGSGVLHADQIFAVHTHGGCPANRGTLLTHAAFANARAQLCIPEAGKVRFDREAYTCADAVEVRVEDLSLIGEGGVDVAVSSDSEVVAETVSLDAAYAATFGDVVPTHAGPPTAGDGRLSVAHGDTLVATYVDADDGGGSPAQVTDTAVLDCVFPTVSDLSVGSVTEVSAVISWSTDEPTTSQLVVEGPTSTLTITDPVPATEHSLLVSPLTGCTEYLFSIRAEDVAGNVTIDDNAGALHPLTSGCPVPPVVPDGSAGTQPMRAGRAPGSRIRMSWDNSCVAGGPTKILYGPLENVAQHEVSGAVCGISPEASQAPWTGVPTGNLWFVLVEDNGLGVEGSWGHATAGERNGSDASGWCDAFVKEPAGTCP